MDAGDWASRRRIRDVGCVRGMMMVLRGDSVMMGDDEMVVGVIGVM